EGVPSLQGGVLRRPARFELQQENWAPATRVWTTLAGATALWWAARRRDAPATLIGLAGLTLLARGATNTPVKRLVGVGSGRRAVDIQKSITIDASPAQVFAFLTEWEEWPRWMSHIREVRVDDRFGEPVRTHWVVDGPLGVPVSWDAITTHLVPNEEIGWETVPGAAVRHSGIIRLVPVDGATRVDVLMSYNPPAGVMGHAVAASVGRDPKRQMDADLARLKTTIETGQPPHDARD
ncbi:MAG TPA: SRPBCC family protein, partial [Gemmatimonadales bacterium]|nr:SRPBCC family protein [Gemmatimonadales bacterium]